MGNNDRITSIVLLLFSSFFFYESFKIETMDLVLIDSAYYPRFVLGLVAFLALVMLVRSFFGPKKEKSKTEEASMDQKKWIVPAIFVLFIVYIFVMGILGFILSSFLFMVALYFMILSEKRTLKNHLFATGGLLIATILVTIFFEKYLNVLLPEGIFF